MTIQRIKRIPSHSGHARFIAEISEEPVGYIQRQQQIPSPYEATVKIIRYLV